MDSSDRKTYNKNYYKNNKSYWFEKLICDVCGSQYDRSHQSRHKKTTKHIIAEKNLIITKLENEINLVKSV